MYQVESGQILLPTLFLMGHQSPWLIRNKHFFKFQ